MRSILQYLEMTCISPLFQITEPLSQHGRSPGDTIHGGLGPEDGGGRRILESLSFGKMSTRAMLLLLLVAQQQGMMEASRSFPISREVDDVGERFQSSTVEEGRAVQGATK